MPIKNLENKNTDRFKTNFYTVSIQTKNISIQCFTFRIHIQPVDARFTIFPCQDIIKTKKEILKKILEH